MTRRSLGKTVWVLIPYLMLSEVLVYWLATPVVKMSSLYLSDGFPTGRGHIFTFRCFPFLPRLGFYSTCCISALSMTVEPSPVRSLAADCPIFLLIKPWLCLLTRSGKKALRGFQQLKKFSFCKDGF